MRRAAPSLLALWLLIPVPALAQDVPETHARYNLYAAGFHVMELDAAFGFGPHHYQVQLAYHTTGVVSLFHHGHQLNTVVGTWDAGRPDPQQFHSIGVWQGEDKVTLIDYLHGQPLIRSLIPSQEKEREPVPLSLQQNSVDSLSALALLVRRVADTGRCEASVHTFDGNRASEITAHTVGEEMLPHNEHSSFTGKALRCDFVGQMLAGFLYQDSSAYDRRPLHGSAWLARLVPGAPPLPVEMQFETHWFGDAHMYLAHLDQVPPTTLAAH
ncbi:MAG TPA: DUF3108 domain-containing protein [Acetobacteraceae bacterium]|jgi:hypothetical protein|nr:DUF3108 domain-containing protein [Acetobacteraceae bacterium]